MLKPIVIVSIFISTFYLLPMSTNKKEIFLSLLNEFQKLKNLEAQYPELKADFNAIAPAHEVEKIGDLLSKQQAKIMAKEEAVGAVQSMDMMEENKKDKLDFATFQDELILWKTNQLEGFYLIENKNKKISKSTLSLHIGAKKERVEGCTLLSNMYSAFEGKLSKEQISIEEIISGFKAVFNEYDFTDTKAMKAWFTDKPSNEWYEKEKKKSFKDNLLNLAGAIGEAVKAENETPAKLVQFQRWYGYNTVSLSNLKEHKATFISAKNLCEQLNNCYNGIDKCQFIPIYLLQNIDCSSTKQQSELIIGQLETNLKYLYSNATEEQKISVCMNMDSINTVGQFVLQSVISNVDTIQLKKYLESSIQAAKSNFKKDRKEDSSIINMYDLYSDMLNLLKNIDNTWIESIVVESIDFLFDDGGIYYKSKNKCLDDLDKGLTKIANNYKEYQITCIEIPIQLIPLDSIVNLLNKNSKVFDSTTIDKYHKDWYRNNWACLKYDIKISDSVEIDKKILLRGFSDIFFREIAHINLPKQWLEEYIIKPFFNVDSTYIKWGDLKETLFEDIIDSNYLQNQISLLISENKLNEAILIGNHWVEYMPTKKQLEDCFRHAIKGNTIDMSGKEGKFILSSNAYFGIMAYFDINIKEQKVHPNNLKANLENIKIEAKVGDLILRNPYGIVLEFISITADSFLINEALERREQKFKLKFKFTKTSSITENENSAIYGFSASYSGVGGSVTLPNKTKSISINTNTQGYLYVDCNFPIYISNNKAYIDMYRSDFYTINKAELLSQNIEVKHHELKVQRK